MINLDNKTIQETSEHLQKMLKNAEKEFREKMEILKTEDASGVVYSKVDNLFKDFKAGNLTLDGYFERIKNIKNGS